MTVSSKVAYWGEWDMGKTHVRHHFIGGGFNTTQFKDYYLHTTYYAGIEDGKHVVDYYRTIRTLDDKIEKVRDIPTVKINDFEKLKNYNVQSHSFYDQSQTLKVAIKQNQKWFFDETQLNKEFYGAKHLYSQLEEAFNRVFNDSTLLLAPIPVMGFDRKGSDQIRSLIAPHKYTFDAISRYKNIRNVVPFKSDIRDKFINPVNILDYSPYANLYDAYTKHKSHIWKLLDNHVAEIRAVEILLKMNKIKYEYFDMDNDRYEKFFGFSSAVPETNYTHLNNNVDINDEKYQFILKVVDEYLDLRKIKDLRLQGFKEDGIE